MKEAYIFTDSLSTIQSLNKNNSTRKWGRTPLRGWIKLLNKYIDNKRIRLIYVKAHSGKNDFQSNGNNQADYLAKSALNDKKYIPIGTPDSKNIYIYMNNQVMLNDIKENLKKFNKKINKTFIIKLKQQSKIILKYKHSENIQKEIKKYAIINNDESIYSFWILCCLKWLINPPFKICIFCKLEKLDTNHIIICNKFKNNLNNFDKKIKNYIEIKLKNKNINKYLINIDTLNNTNKYAFYIGFIPNSLQKKLKNDFPKDYKIEINELRIFVLKNFYEYYKIIINEIETEIKNNDTKDNNEIITLPLSQNGRKIWKKRKIKTNERKNSSKKIKITSKNNNKRNSSYIDAFDDDVKIISKKSKKSSIKNSKSSKKNKHSSITYDADYQDQFKKKKIRLA